MKQYETYKDSGIQWLGQIPSHWMQIKLKYTCQITDGTHFSPSTIDVGMPYITVSNVHDNIIDVENANRISLEDYNILVSQGCQPQLGDVLLAKDGTVGRTAIVVNDNKYVVLSSLGILHPMSGLSSEYLKYSLDSIYLQEQMNAAMAGSALRRITISKISEFLLLVPSIKEQQAIASYLDYKVGQIDAAIKEKEVILEDLKAYRTAIISEAVTKGLDKNVEMKDSGNLWIGKCPANWKIYSIKRVAMLVRGGSPRPIEKYLTDDENGYNWIKIGDAVKGEKYITSTKQRIIPKGLSATREVHKGDLILSNSMSFGQPYILAIDGCIHDGWLALADFKGVDKEFMYYYLMSSSSANQFAYMVDGGVVQNLNIEKVGAASIVVPPLNEQLDIVRYLDKKIQSLEKAITEVELQIEDLKSYKSSVISEAVTGKVDLREWKCKTANA